MPAEDIVWVKIDPDKWLTAWWHQAITWTNVDLSLVRSSDIYLRTVSQQIPEPFIAKVSLNIYDV